MKEYLKEKIVSIVDGKLSDGEIEDLICFFKFVLEKGIEQGDDNFFKDLAFEMSGSVKELALLIIEFRRDLKAKIHPDITDLTTKYIPQAADQLEGIIETTEVAANKIMDNLEILQEQTGQMEHVLDALKAGRVKVPGDSSQRTEGEIDLATIQKIAPLIDYVDTSNRNCACLVSDVFTQMSFQDLTGQRIRRIMSLVQQMEQKLTKMVVSFGIKVAEKEKNPAISAEELQQAVADKQSALVGPQKAGCGMDQAGIDDLLASI